MTETISVSAKSTSAKSTPFAESTLTDRYQTTVPAPVRKALGLSKQDKIAYAIDAEGKVYLSRVVEEESDPVLQKFAVLIAEDIAQNPQNVQPVPLDLIARASALVAGMDSDLDKPIPDEADDRS